MYFGVSVTILITFFWVGTTHCFKFLFLPSTQLHHSLSSSTSTHTTTSVLQSLQSFQTLPYSSSITTQNSMPSFFNENATLKPTITKTKTEDPAGGYQFNAPFFAAWFCTNFSILFFPIYLIGRGFARQCGAETETLGDIMQGFRDRGFTIGRFLNRCLTFCLLFLLSTYLYVRSLNMLFSTDVIVLFATNVASVYLLSWVILHEQFVGVRVRSFVYLLYM